MNLDTDLILLIKKNNNSKRIIDPNVQHKSKKSQKITGENLHDFRYSDASLDKTHSMREIIDKLDFTKIKNF